MKYGTASLWSVAVSLLVLLAVPLVVTAGTVTVPNTFTNNTTADANEVNANFDAVETAVNHNDSRITAVETAADAAQASAAAAQTSADAAQASADAAQTSADAAQGTAAAAQNSAEAAQGTADAAATSAAAAATAASNAQSSADSAQAAINSHLSPGCTANYALAASACPFSGSDLEGYNELSNCMDAPTDSLCEGDGECGTSNDLNNCVSGYDVYYKVDSS